MRLNVRIKLNDFIGNGEEIVVEKLKQFGIKINNLVYIFGMKKIV